MAQKKAAKKTGKKERKKSSEYLRKGLRVDLAMWAPRHLRLVRLRQISEIPSLIPRKSVVSIDVLGELEIG